MPATSEMFSPSVCCPLIGWSASGMKPLYCAAMRAARAL